MNVDQEIEDGLQRACQHQKDSWRDWTILFRVGIGVCAMAIMGSACFFLFNNILMGGLMLMGFGALVLLTIETRNNRQMFHDKYGNLIAEWVELRNRRKE